MNRTLPLLPLRTLMLGAAVTALTLSAALTVAAPGNTTSGLDLAGMERSVTPGDDFFRYANGAWLAKTEIPPDRYSFGVDAILEDLTRKRTAELIQGAAQGAPPYSDAAKVGTYYAAYLDEASIESAGLKPLQQALERIETRLIKIRCVEGADPGGVGVRRRALG